MAEDILMPKLSDTMEEGRIIKWFVKEGDRVSGGDVIAEIETDKADMEFEAIDDGVVLKIVASEGQTVAVGEPIAVFGKPGEKADVSAEPAKRIEDERGKASKKKPKKEAAAGRAVKKAKPAEEPAPERPAPTGRAAVKASPVARRLAEEADVDIGRIEGSGPEGRVVKRDIEALLAGRDRQTASVSDEAERAPAVSEPPTRSGERARLSLMRKTIARRMSQSKATVPHFYLTAVFEMDQVVQARRMLNTEEGVNISINDFLVKACAKALMAHPQVNARLADGGIEHLASADVGVATALEEGLVTPVVRNSQSKTLLEISEEIRDLVDRARRRKLLPEEYAGGSMTVSNLGMYGVEQFAAIINPPESTILAVGAVAEEAVVREGRVEVGQRMRATLSCDHRVVDGAVGAQFLATLKQILANPIRLLV